MDKVKLINAYDLLEKLTVNSNGKRIPETDCDNFPVTISLKEIKKMIIDQPVAYDIDIVIEDLLSEKEYELTGIYNSHIEHMMAEEKMWYKNGIIDECIEIVKRRFEV